MPLPTLFLLDSFEHGTIGAGAAGPYDTVTASPAIVTTPVRTGSRALEISTSAAAENVRHSVPATNRIVACGFYIRFASLPTATVQLAVFFNASGNGLFRFNNTSGRFEVAIGGGAGVSVGPSTVSVNTWYRVVVEFDSSTGTAAVKAIVNGENEGTQTAAQAAADITAASLGTNAAHTFTAYYDDWIGSITDGDYEVIRDQPSPADWSVLALLPTADGTHNTGSGGYQDQVPNALNDATTTSWQLLDDAPMDRTPTDFIRQTTSDTASYMEHTYGDLPAGTDVPADCRGLCVDRDAAGAGATPAIFRFLLSDSTAVTPDIRLSTDDPGTTITSREKVLDRPAGGWTRTLVDGIKSRWGFGDGAPDSDCSSAMFEAAMFPAPPASSRRTHFPLLGVGT